MNVEQTAFHSDRVLVVEDDVDLRRVLVGTLQTHGFETAEASNGAEALERLRRQGAELVLLDLMMPVMNGWEFRAEQMKDPDLASTPVLVLTAGDGHDALKIEADGYLKKPIDTRFLIANIQRAIRSAQARRLARAERLAALGTLAAAMAHEINNPLSYVVANLQDLCERMPQFVRPERTHDVEPAVQEALGGALRIRDVVRQVRELAGVGDAEPGYVEVDRCIEAALDVARPALEGVSIVRRSTAVPLVRATELGLTHVLSSVIRRAAQGVRAAPRDRAVLQLSSRVTLQGNVEIEVAERWSEPQNGRRVPPSETPEGLSTGIGLGLCQGLVKSWGGDLEFESSDTTMVARLCFAPATEPRISPSPPATDQASRRARILVVDDEPAVARAVARVLRNDHDVTCAYGGDQALRILDGDADFDLIVCDVVMPGVGGEEVYRIVGRRYPGLERKMVFVSGGAFTEKAVSFLDRIDNPTLNKPFDRAEMMEVISAALAKSRE